MASLPTKIILCCEANGKVADFDIGGNVTVSDDLIDGVSSPYISKWTVDGLTKPTDSQLASYETAGNTSEKNEKTREARKKSYGDIGDQLDEIYKDIDAWKARIKKIKDDNPKE